MNYEISIKVDTNDADYITGTTEITSKDLELIRPLIAAIQKFNEDHKGEHNVYNYPFHEFREDDPRKPYGFSDEVHDLFEDLCPYGEHGFHTVELITITPAVEKTVLLRSR